MSLARVFAMKFSRVYPLHVQKAEKKGRTQAEVDEVIRWLTGYLISPEPQFVIPAKAGGAFQQPKAGHPVSFAPEPHEQQKPSHWIPAKSMRE